MRTTVGWGLVGLAVLSLLAGALLLAILLGLVAWLVLRNRPEPDPATPASPLPRWTESPPALPAPSPTLFSGVDAAATGSGLHSPSRARLDRSTAATGDVLDDLDRFLDAPDS